MGLLWVGLRVPYRTPVGIHEGYLHRVIDGGGWLKSPLHHLSINHGLNIGTHQGTRTASPWAALRCVSPISLITPWYTHSYLRPKGLR